MAVMLKVGEQKEARRLLELVLERLETNPPRRLNAKKLIWQAYTSPDFGGGPRDYCNGKKRYYYRLRNWVIQRLGPKLRARGYRREWKHIYEKEEQ